MDQTDLIARFSQRPGSFAWLIGAGASRTSGLPTANDILDDLKRRYYCRQENADISRHDMRNDAVRAWVQGYMDAKSFPARLSPEEYSGYFDAIFGEDKERQRNYLRAMLSEDKVKLTAGNRAMAAMLVAGHIRALFTTNFDSVVERAVAEVSGRSIAAYHLDGSIAAVQALNNEEYPLYVKLHGDFRYDSIKNLTADLLHQDQRLALCAKAAATRFGFIVAGYSGRDASIMALLSEALDQPNAFAAGLFWTDVKGACILPAVGDLIAKARAKGIPAGVVDIQTFDTLMLRLWRSIDDKDADLDAKVRRSMTADVDIPIPPSGNSRPLLRLNALPIERMPNRALHVAIDRAVDWTELRTLQRKAAGPIVFTKGDRVLAWGEETEVRGLFGAALVSLEPVDLPMDDAAVDTLVRGFLEEALVLALARGRPLIARSHRRGGMLIVDRHAPDLGPLSPIKAKAGALAGPIPRLMTPATDRHPKPEALSWAEALRVSVTWKNGQAWLLIDPDIWVWSPRGRELATEFLDGRRRNRYNNRHNDLLSAWIEVLFGKADGPTRGSFTLIDGEAAPNNPAFSIYSQTGFAWRQKA